MATAKIINPLIPTMATRLAVCLDEKSFHGVLSRFGLPKEPWPLGGTCDAATCTYDNMVVVCLDPETENTTAVMVHEASHVFDSFAAFIAEEAPSAEFKAYGLQAIFEVLASEFERQTKGA